MGANDPLDGNRTTVLRCRKHGGPAMPSSEYFRPSRHLLSFSLIASGEEVSSQLMAMAHDYMTNADAIEADSKPRLAAIIAQDASPDLETNGPQRARDTTGFVGPNQPHSEEDGRVAQSVERVCEQHETVVRIHSPAANCVLSTTVTERYVSHARLASPLPSIRTGGITSSAPASGRWPYL